MIAPFDYSLRFDCIDFRKRPDLYRVRFNTPALARRSSAAILRRFRGYRRKRDFVGMDMARKFLQMGYTRARRYANYRGGRKYAAGRTRLLPRGGDPVKAQSAAIFYAAWRQTAADPTYRRLMKEHRRRHELSA